MILKDRRVLARLMIVDGVTQRELAAAAGWASHSYLGRLLRGEATKVAPGPADRIAERLGVETADLFTDPDR